MMFGRGFGKGWIAVGLWGLVRAEACDSFGCGAGK